MNFFLILLSLLLVSCSSNLNKLQIDIDELKKQGSVFSKSDNLSPNDFDNLKINSVILYPDHLKMISEDSGYSFFNSANFILTKLIDLNYSIIKKNHNFILKKNNFFQKEITKYEGNLVTIDDDSNLIIIDKNLDLIKKFSIYKKSYFHNYNLKFSLLVKNEVLYFADNLGSITAYHLKEQKILWKNSLNVPFLSNLIIYKNSIFVLNSNGKLYSFDIANGKQNWSFETGTNVIKSSESYKMSMFEGKIVFSNDLGILYCLDLDKQAVLWTYNLPITINGVNRDLFKLANLVIEKNYLYVVSTLGNLIKLSINDGNILWISNVTSTATPVINPKTIFVLTSDGNFIILDKDKGKILYQKKLINLLSKKNSKIKLLNFVLGKDKFYITTNNGNFFEFKISDLNDIKIKKISDKINSNTIILDQKIFFIGENGIFYKIQ